MPLDFVRKNELSIDRSVYIFVPTHKLMLEGIDQISQESISIGTRFLMCPLKCSCTRLLR